MFICNGDDVLSVHYFLFCSPLNVFDLLQNKALLRHCALKNIF